jgi:putative membrane protein
MSGPDDDQSQTIDASRRTALAAERTWLAWWRTGLGVTAVAIGVGRFLPGLASSPRLPLQLLGLGYGILAVAVLVIGGVRQSRVAEAMRRGGYDQLSAPVVMWLTVVAVALALATLLVVALGL